ncbi:MAG: hypothetical protein LBD90_07920 [Bifidobacteriaceae bacterium]|jgi:hypothetical protein|nr:hypothetical protein [Bifidobacteriaceae bacterium]
MGRYRLDAELFSNLPGAVRFRATDKILAREADVYLLSGPHKAEAIDAARRAALVDDPRLARVIDAGTYSGIAFVLTAPLEGVSLADVGPLTAAQARGITGEVAAALAVAAQADVHHLALRPELVFLGRGDTIEVGGLAWDAALRGQADADPAQSDLIDARALVSVLYAALTARWPGQTPSVMPAPPLWDGNPVAPMELVSAVPGDLNTLCAVSLTGGVGPASAAAVVEDLGVWPEVRIALRHSVSVRGPIPHAVTPPLPQAAAPPTLDEAALELPDPAQPQPQLPDAVPPAPSPAALPAGAEPMRPTDADVAALAADEEIQKKLAAIEAILVPLGYDLTPTLRRLGLSPGSGLPRAPGAAPSGGRGSTPEELRAKLDAAWAEAEAEGWQRPGGDDPAAGAPAEAAWAEPASEPLPPAQAELLDRLTSLADQPLPNLPEIPEVPDLDLPPLPDDLSELLASAALAGLPDPAAGGAPAEPGPTPPDNGAGGAAAASGVLAGPTDAAGGVGGATPAGGGGVLAGPTDAAGGVGAAPAGVGGVLAGQADAPGQFGAAYSEAATWAANGYTDRPSAYATADGPAGAPALGEAAAGGTAVPGETVGLGGAAAPGEAAGGRLYGAAPGGADPGYGLGAGQVPVRPEPGSAGQPAAAAAALDPDRLSALASLVAAAAQAEQAGQPAGLTPDDFRLSGQALDLAVAQASQTAPSLEAGGAPVGTGLAAAAYFPAPGLPALEDFPAETPWPEVDQAALPPGEEAAVDLLGGEFAADDDSTLVLEPITDEPGGIAPGQAGAAEPPRPTARFTRSPLPPPPQSEADAAGALRRAKITEAGAGMLALPVQRGGEVIPPTTDPGQALAAPAPAAADGPAAAVDEWPGAADAAWSAAAYADAAADLPAQTTQAAQTAQTAQAVEGQAYSEPQFAPAGAESAADEVFADAPPPQGEAESLPDAQPAPLDPAAPAAGAEPMFDTQTPAFEGVLEAPAPGRLPPARGWLAVVVFAVVVAVCVLLGVVILNKVGILGAPLPPGWPLDGLAAWPWTG